MIPDALTAPVRLKDFKTFQCKARCGAAVAQTDGAFAYVDGLILSKHFVYTCLACQSAGHWFPVDRKPAPFALAEIETCLKSYQNLYTAHPNLCQLACPHCEQRIAYTDRARLYVAGLVLAHEVRFKCLYCRKNGVWQPDLTPISRCGWGVTK